jgi:hypothetical protein
MSTKQDAKVRAAVLAISIRLQHTTCVEAADEPGLYRVATEAEADVMARVAMDVLHMRGMLR